MGDKVANLVAVTPFVIVPAYELNEVAVKSNTCGSVEDRSSCVGNEVA